MHDRPAMRLLHDDGSPIRGIARDVGASRNAVRRALRPGSKDHYYRPSASEDAEPAVRDVLADYPDMVVADVAVLIDWRHSRRTLSDLVARLRPIYRDSSPGLDARADVTLRAGTLAAQNIECGTLTVQEVQW
ncbi:hypothetical protein [Arthrobacter sp. lap29]|uniref:hypothetical protein n=1 Tax=Arthrobacter sp. lap29 TaxID=3056122 RepID=UPI0028F6E66F|nr:hypothetical protein [Arthrobacter sp. lap29]